MNGLFENVKFIQLLYHDKIIKSNEDVRKLQNIFNNITLQETSDSLEGVMGGLLLLFTYNDNSVRNIHFTSKLLSDGIKTYSMSCDICQAVRSIFS